MNSRFISILKLIGFGIMILFLWFLSNLSGFLYKEKVEISLSFIGALIGGVTTLAAVYITTMETRKIQTENMDNSNKIITLQILNEKINDYRKVHISSKLLLEILDGISLDKLSQVIGDVQIEMLLEEKDKINKHIEEIDLNSNCLLLEEYNRLIESLLDNSENLNRHFNILAYEASFSERMYEVEIIKKLKCEMEKNLKIILESIEQSIREFYENKYKLSNNKEN